MRTLFFILLLFCSTNTYAQTASSFCNKGVSPFSYSSPHYLPVVQMWTQSDIVTGHLVADCAKWFPDNFTLGITLGGSFRYKGSADSLLAQFGKISSLRGVSYWSVTDKRWEILIPDATAMHGPDGEQRADFTLDELRSGKNLYFTQKDNRSSKLVVYRMQVDTSNPKRMLIRIANVSSLYFLMMPIFKANDIQLTYILEPLSPQTWGYFNILGVRNNLGITTANEKNSWINRAVAMYSHFTGIQIEKITPLVQG